MFCLQNETRNFGIRVAANKWLAIKENWRKIFRGRCDISISGGEIHCFGSLQMNYIRYLNKNNFIFAQEFWSYLQHLGVHGHRDHLIKRA